MKMIKALYEQDNCDNQTEFIEKAVNFYISYLTTNKETNFLNPMLYSAIKSAITESESKQSGNIFRLAVEMSMMMNLIAVGMEIDDEQLNRMRSRCIKEVRKSRGKVMFEEALEYQRGE